LLEKENQMARLLIAALLGAAAITPLLAQPAPVAPVAPLAPVAPMAARAPMAPMTRATVQARVQAQFARRDANHDGFLTADELAVRGVPGGQRTIIVRRMGPGGAAPQAMGDAGAAFDRLDANHDGSISRAEFGQARQIRIEKRVMAGGQPGAMGQMQGMGRPGAMRMMRNGGGGMMGAMLLQHADTNRDGRVSLAEATGAALQHFDMIDANRDGIVTPDERAAGRQRMMRMHGAG
jgi:Ca2+-binding EF-hand superfamily protein